MSKPSEIDVDARLHPRYPASAVPSIVGVRLSRGEAVELVNISKSGVLVEGRTRFVSGTRVTVTLDGGFTPPNHEAKIVRCQMSSILGGALSYRSGIQFDHPLDVLDIAPPALQPCAPERAGTTPAAPPAPHAALGEQALGRSQRPPARRRAVNRW